MFSGHSQRFSTISSNLKLSSLILPIERRDLAKGLFNMEGPSLITSDGTTSKPLNYTTQDVAMVS